MATPFKKRSDFYDDTHLWKGVLNGDRRALSQLFKRFYPPLFNYGLKLYAREELVKDSIQELFYTIWEKRNQLSDVEYVRSYIYSSFRRTVFRQAEIESVRNKRDKAYSEESFRELVNKEQLMILNELKREQKRKLQNALQTLSKRQKEAVFLKFQNGLSNQEIALVMDVNKQSVYNYIHRAIAALQEYLQVESGSDQVFKKVFQYPG